MNIRTPLSALALLICLGICATSNADQQRTCFLKSPAGAWDFGGPDLRLFLTGLNHDPNHPGAVTQKGVNELADFIAREGGDPENIVVALSASDIPNIFTEGCPAGPKTHPDGRSRNGECLAWGLQQRLHVEFTIQEYYRDDWLGGGYAIITGPRWVAQASAWDLGSSANLRAVLSDTRFVNGQRNAFTLVVTHLSGDEAALPALREITTALRNIDVTRNLAPLVVGDFNNGVPYEGNAPTTAQFIKDNYDWPAHVADCPAITGVQPHVSMSIDDKMQVLVGKLDGPTNFSCGAGTMQAVRVSYSADATGQATRPSEGIALPDITHNVVGLGFRISAHAPKVCPANSTCTNNTCVPWPDEPTCPPGKHYCDCTGACATAAQCRACEHQSDKSGKSPHRGAPAPNLRALQHGPGDR